MQQKQQQCNNNNKNGINGISLSRAGGYCISTQKGYKVAEQLYNIYANHQSVSMLGAITEEECTARDGDYIKKRFGEFASFLLRYQHEKGGKMLHLKSSCQVQYLSNAFNFLRKKYPKALALKKGADDNKVSH
jgi:hypothetical protein